MDVLIDKIPIYLYIKYELMSLKNTYKLTYNNKSKKVYDKYLVVKEKTKNVIIFINKIKYKTNNAKNTTINIFKKIWQTIKKIKREITLFEIILTVLTIIGISIKLYNFYKQFIIISSVVIEKFQIGLELFVKFINYNLQYFNNWFIKMIINIIVFIIMYWEFILMYCLFLNLFNK